MGIHPDLSSWGKCIAYGHPISALMGAEKARTATRHLCASLAQYVHERAMTEADIDSALNAAEGAFGALNAKRASLPPIEKLRAFLTPRTAPVLAEAD